jgi:outer membrane immunogenic protein
MAGGQIGYNYQIGSWVLGLEVDYQWAEIAGSMPVAGGLAVGQVTSFGTARGRLGFAWDRALIYGTGGGAWGRGSVNVAGAPDEVSHTGWTIGGGLEYGITPNLSAKVEYLFVRLNSRNYFLNAGCAANCDFGADVNAVRAGLNYRFNWAVIR